MGRFVEFVGLTGSRPIGRGEALSGRVVCALLIVSAVLAAARYGESQ